MSKEKIKKSLVVFKANDLNLAFFENFQLNTYQVLIFLITKVEGYKNWQNPEKSENQKFTLSALEFGKVFHIGYKSCYRILKTSVDKLLNIQFVLKNPNPNKTSYYKINICAAAEYIENEGMINVEFTPQIKPYLERVKKNFTLYQLREITSFKSLHTTRLYELLMQYKSTGWVIISIKDLRNLFSADKKLKGYHQFKTRTFERGCREINGQHNLNVRFEEIYEGVKIVKVKFLFDV